MPKVKTLLVLIAVVALSFSLIGCDLLPFSSADQDLVASLDGELPGWLLLSHRSAVDPDAADDDLLNPKEPLAEEEKEAEPAAEVPASSGSGSTQPQQPSDSGSGSSGSGSSGTPTSSDPQPGTREYLAWFAANGAKQPYNVDMLQWYAETQGGITESYADWKKAKDEKEASGGGNEGWFDGFDSGSPSGFRKTTEENGD
jgi:hypothetical protein